MKMRSTRGTAATRADTATMNTVLMRLVTCPLWQICLIYMMLTSRWVGSVMFAFEEVVHWLQTAAGDHLHLRLPKLQRLELERNGDHRCAGHRRQRGALLQGALHLLLRQDKTRQTGSISISFQHPSATKGTTDNYEATYCKKNETMCAFFGVSDGRELVRPKIELILLAYKKSLSWTATTRTSTIRRSTRRRATPTPTWSGTTSWSTASSASATGSRTTSATRISSREATVQLVTRFLY